MTASEQLLMAACALSFYGVGQVWLVQLSSYPLWTYVGEREFHAYHRAWWRSIWGVYGCARPEFRPGRPGPASPFRPRSFSARRSGGAR